jgi:predicted PurR-regulated permease PerM
MEIAKKALIISAVVAGFAAALYLAFISRTVVLYVVVSIFLAIVLDPLVEKLERARIKKVWAAILTIFVLIAIASGIIALILLPLLTEGANLAENLPEITSKITSDPTWSGIVAKYNLFGSLENLSGQAKALLLGGSSLLSVAGNVVRAFSAGAIIVVMTFLFLIEGENMWESSLKFLRPSDANAAKRTGREIRRAIAGFITGNLLTSLIAGLVALTTLLLLKVPYAFALAALVALFDLIPMIGAAIATIAVGFIALTKGLMVAIIAVAVLLVYQFFEGNILQPMVYSRSINLSPLFIVIASILGAEIAGITGVLLAIPVGAVLQIVGREIYEHYVDGAQSA